MSIVHLRKMTAKSKIGFGQYTDLTIQEVIQLGVEHKLIAMYYNLGGIDFCDELKERLCITGDRIIPKPGKAPEKYSLFVKDIFKDYNDKRSGFEADQALRMGVKQKNAAAKGKKAVIQKEIGRMARKINNKNYIQGKISPITFK